MNSLERGSLRRGWNGKTSRVVVFRGIAVATVEHAAPRTVVSTEVLYRRNAERVWRYCLHFLRRPADAEDAVQQTFLYAHRALERGVEPESETAWLLTIARNVCLTRAKSYRRLAELAEDPRLLDETLAADEVERGISDEVREAFASLPERQRRALFLREWQECSYAEIAEALGTSESAVETLLVRARRTLARELAATRRRVGDLAGLLGWLRTVLGSTAAKVAVGAAVVGAGATGVTVTTQTQHATRPVPVRHSHAVVQPAHRSVQPVVRRAVPKPHVARVVRHAPAAKRAVAPPPAAPPPAVAPPASAPASTPPPAAPAPSAPPAHAAAPAPAAQPSAAPAAAPPPPPSTTTVEATTTTVSDVVTTATSTATAAVSSTVDAVAQTVSNAVPAAAPVVTTAAQTVDQTVNQTTQTVNKTTQSVVSTVSNLLSGR